MNKNQKDLLKEAEKEINKKLERLIKSSKTKNDLVNIYKIKPEKIKVIYLGGSLENVKPKKVVGLPENYILFVGNRGGYKNFTSFLHSASSVLKKYDINLSLDTFLNGL